jgi:hypothetical protein
MYASVRFTVTVYTYLLVRQPGSTAGSRVVFPDRRFITLSPVVPLSPLGNSWHTNFPKGGFGGCESMHVSGGAAIFGPLLARRSGSMITAVPAKDAR